MTEIDRPGVTAERPTQVDDHAGWQAYHMGQADLIAQQSPGPDLPTRLGQLQGEMDHRSAALGYAEQARLARFQEASYQAGRQYASLPEPALGQIDFSKPVTIHRREDFERGIQDYQKEHHMAETREIDNTPEKPIVSQAWLEKEANTIKQATDIAVPAAEITLAKAYWNGRREGYNSAREDVIDRNPGRTADLPAAIQVDEIQIRQQALKREQDRSLVVAR